MASSLENTYMKEATGRAVTVELPTHTSNSCVMVGANNTYNYYSLLNDCFCAQKCNGNDENDVNTKENIDSDTKRGRSSSRSETRGDGMHTTTLRVKDSIECQWSSVLPSQGEEEWITVVNSEETTKKGMSKKRRPRVSRKAKRKKSVDLMFTTHQSIYTFSPRTYIILHINQTQAKVDVLEGMNKIQIKRVSRIPIQKGHVRSLSSVMKKLPKQGAIQTEQLREKDEVISVRHESAQVSKERDILYSQMLNLASELDKIQWDLDTAKLTSSSAGLVGAVITIGGPAFAPVILGASAGLTAASIAISRLCS